jgi:hypothetical protein
MKMSPSEVVKAFVSVSARTAAFQGGKKIVFYGYELLSACAGRAIMDTKSAPSKALGMVGRGR